MAIKGSLKEASLPDVLQLLALGQKTGCLSLTDRANLGYIYFEQGRITHASIVNRRDRLGDMLLNSGRITKEQLDAAVERQASDRDKRLGAILVELGALDRAELERYMRVQVEEAIYYLFTWQRGSFQFEVDDRPDESEFSLSINPESLLLEGARRIDEWGLIEKKIPSFDLVFSLDAERLQAAGVALTDAQRAILSLVDGTHDVASIVERTGLGEFEVGKALYGLVTAGFAHKVRSSIPTQTSQATEARIEEHRNLGVAFYRTGMLDEASREFRRVIELNSRHTHAHFFLGLVAVQQGEWREAAEAFERVIELGPPRASVLYNLAVCMEHLGDIERAETLYGDAAALDKRDPRILTGWGIGAFRQKHYDVAIERLDRAREMAGDRPLPVIWYWARALAAAASQDLARSEAITEEGLRTHPGDAVLRNNLAVLLEQQGKLEQAEAELREVIATGATLPQLYKNLGDIQYRRTRYDDAWEAYERAVQLAPELGDDVYFKLGNIAYKRSAHDVAASMWLKTLERNPDHQLARTNLDTMNALRG